MGWKNIVYLVTGKQGRSGRAKSQASLEDGIKDPTESKKTNARSHDMDGRPFRYKEEKEAAGKARRESVPGMLREQDDPESEYNQLGDLFEKLSGDENRASEYVETKFSKDSEQKREGLKRLISKYKKKQD